MAPSHPTKEGPLPPASTLLPHSQHHRNALPRFGSGASSGAGINAGSAASKFFPPPPPPAQHMPSGLHTMHGLPVLVPRTPIHPHPVAAPPPASINQAPSSSQPSQLGVQVSAKLSEPLPVSAPAPAPTPIPTAVSPAAQERPVAPPTFAGLVQELVHHRFMPLLFRDVYETASGSAPVVLDPRAAASIKHADGEAKNLCDLARAHGLGHVASTGIRRECVDVVMAGLVSALSSLRQPTPPLTSTALGAQLKACAEASASRSPCTSTSAGETRAATTRNKLPENARKVLEKWFNDNFVNPYPTDAEKRRLAAECNIQLTQVNNFFGNKRMRLKRKVIERNKKAARDPNNPTAAPYEASVLAPRVKWRSIVCGKAADDDDANAGPGAQHDALVDGLFRGSGAGGTNNAPEMLDELAPPHAKRRRPNSW